MDKLKEIIEAVVRIPCMFFALFGPSICLMESFNNYKLLAVGMPFGIYLTWMFFKGMEVRDIEWKDHKRFEEEQIRMMKERDNK